MAHPKKKLKAVFSAQICQTRSVDLESAAQKWWVKIYKWIHLPKMRIRMREHWEQLHLTKGQPGEESTDGD